MLGANGHFRVMEMLHLRGAETSHSIHIQTDGKKIGPKKPREDCHFMMRSFSYEKNRFVEKHSRIDAFEAPKARQGLDQVLWER